MKIAYVMSGFDASNVNVKYGIGWYITEYLGKHGAELEFFGPYKEKNKVLKKAEEVLYNRVSSKKYWRSRNLNTIKYFSEQSSKEISTSDADIVLSFGSLPLAFIETDKPVVIWTDAIFDGLLNFYDEYSNLSDRTINDAKEIEKNAFKRADILIVSSQWAKESAIKHYKVPEERIKIINFGALLQEDPDKDLVKKIINKKQFDTIKLLFLGREWERKGGPLAVEVVKKLNLLGLKSELHIVGLKDLPIEKIPDYIINHGFISKREADGEERLNKIISDSHFLLVSSRAEATPHVFNEVNSWGVPCISSNAGGIPSVISDNVNGKLFSLDSNPEEYVNYIAKIVKNKEEYQKLCYSSLNEYHKRLNWNVSTEKLIQLMKTLV